MLLFEGIPALSGALKVLGSVYGFRSQFPPNSRSLRPHLEYLRVRAPLWIHGGQSEGWDMR